MSSRRPDSRMPPPEGRRRLVLLAGGAAVTLALAVLSVFRPPLLSDLDRRVYDTLCRSEERSEPYPRVAVVELDEKSLDRFGRWPWPRALVARLLERISRERPAAVGVDVLFAEMEPAAAGGARLSPGDSSLAEVLAASRPVLGYQFCFRGQPPGCSSDVGLPPPRLPALTAANWRAVESRLWHADGAVGVQPDLARASSTGGFLNATPDPDGVLRRVPVVIEYRGELYPSLALATWMRGAEGARVVLRVDERGAVSLDLGGVRAPLDDFGNLLVRYRGSEGFPRVSASDVLDGAAPAGLLTGKLVFVGGTAAGLAEAMTTSLRAVLPGVEVHASVADNLLSGRFLSRPSDAPALELAAVVLLGLGSAAILLWGRSFVSAAILAACAAGLWSGSAFLFRSRGLFLSPLFPLLTLASVFPLLTLLKLVSEQRRLKRRNRDLAATQQFMTGAMVSLAEIRDSETGAHILRTQRYLRVLCETLARHPRFAAFLTRETIDLVSQLAPLHDIGKVGVPDGLLRKPGKLTPEEFSEVRRHALYGRDAIEKAESRAGVRTDELLTFAKQIVYCHHERWDGTGYPEGLRGEKIPVLGRLMALVDVYDALVSPRVYKPPVPHERAVEEILTGRGTQFDPDVVDAFLLRQAEWRSISLQPGEGPGAEPGRAQAEDPRYRSVF